MNIFLLTLLIFFMTVSGTMGAFFFKKAISEQTKVSMIQLLFHWQLYVGALFYLLGAVLNIFLLRFMDYSILYPMTALTYIWTVILSYFTLHEKITKNKVLAIIFIIAGVMILNL